MNKYDVIIIGGGLSGCVLGYLLKKSNRKVLIVEKQDTKNKTKLCGGIITNKAYCLLKQIYEKDISQINFTKHEKCYLHNNNNKIKIKTSIYTVPRKELDDFALNQYLQINGELIDKTSYTNLDIDKKELTINNKIYFFDYLVGADGVLSKLRRELTGKKQKTNFALESIQDIKKNNNLEIHFLNGFKGYGWIILNSTQIITGIGNVSKKTNINKDYDAYTSQINFKIENKKGAFLPSGNNVLLEFNNNIKFIGDAAGLISPITGEGIFFAVMSAKILSNDFNNYKKNIHKIVNRIRKENFYKIFIYNQKVRNYIFERSNNKFIKKIINKFVETYL